MSWFIDTFSQQVWEKKYRGTSETIEEYFRRMADMVAQGDQERSDQYYQLFYKSKFSPGGRILAHAGRPKAQMSLMNCTTHTPEDDSLEAISRSAYRIMRASSRGQGIGLDLSTLRPKGSPVNNAAVASTGAISFMEMLNAVAGTIGQESRRAAVLYSMDVNHPDLWRPGEHDLLCPKCNGSGCEYCDNEGFLPYDFLHIKKIPGKVEGANISVRPSDDFMEAVLNDLPWAMSYTGTSGGKTFTVQRVVRARDLFHKLAKSAFDSAEPGVLFVDTARKMSNSDLFGPRWSIVSTNACSEEWLDQDGVCNLGSMILSSYIVHPFTSIAYFDYGQFSKDVALAIRFLDEIVTLEINSGNYISEEQLESLEYIRRLGLGTMGLADALAMMGLRYEANSETLTFLHRVYSTLRDTSFQTSIDLAKELGPAKVWTTKPREEWGEIAKQAFFGTLPEHLQKQIAVYGTRNIGVLSIAPTGSISNLFGVSSGIEPPFALSYTRMTRIFGEDRQVEYVPPAVRMSREAGLPDSIWQTAYQVSPKDHVSIQAYVQMFIDASISKTLNFPSTATEGDVAEAYLMGWSMGLKGMSVYVDGSRDLQVLTETKEEEKDLCPACGAGMIHEDGCEHCSQCEYSVCSL